MKIGHILRQIPLIGAVALIYWLLALLGPSDVFSRSLLAITLPSGTVWTITTAQLLLVLGLVTLYLEILKSTRASQIIDHILSLVAFIISLIAFLLAPRLGTADFLLLLLMQLIDVVAGFSVSLTAARRDITYVDERT